MKAARILRFGPPNVRDGILKRMAPWNIRP
jgi:hypothetical protein